MKFLTIVASAALTCLIVFLSNINVIAISNNLVVYQVQTGSTASASSELVLLYNLYVEDVNISDWCLHYSSASDVTKRVLTCIDSDSQTEIWLSSGGVASFASGEFVLANPGFVPDFTFTSGLAAGGGHIWITDQNNTVIDRLGWGTAVLPETLPSVVHASGQVLSRNLDLFLDSDNNSVDFSSKSIHNPIVSGLFEVEVPVDVCLNIDGLQTVLPDGYLNDGEDCYQDVCSNIDELQKTVPLGYEKQETGAECFLIPLSNLPVLITEILPNFPSSDTGNEFIELYNPNSSIVDLSGYKIQVGPSFSKEFIFTAGSIAPGQYLTFSDTQTGIVLPNSTGVILRIISPAGSVVGQSEVYSNADDDVSWALVDGRWIYTNQITPGSANLPYIEPAIDEEVGVTSVLAPCPAGKYRNPATNRCRNIETAVSSLVPCDEDEYRNPETNRCRKVSTASSLIPCDEGEERNPETNRCRKVATLASVDTALTSVEDIESASTPASINWLIVVLAFSGTLAYMVYEWRFEIRQKLIQVRN